MYPDTSRGRYQLKGFGSQKIPKIPAPSSPRTRARHNKQGSTSDHHSDISSKSKCTTVSQVIPDTRTKEENLIAKLNVTQIPPLEVAPSPPVPKTSGSPTRASTTSCQHLLSCSQVSSSVSLISSPSHSISSSSTSPQHLSSITSMSPSHHLVSCDSSISQSHCVLIPSTSSAALSPSSHHSLSPSTSPVPLNFDYCQEPPTSPLAAESKVFASSDTSAHSQSTINKEISTTVSQNINPNESSISNVISTVSNDSNISTCKTEVQAACEMQDSLLSSDGSVLRHGNPAPALPPRATISRQAPERPSVSNN